MCRPQALVTRIKVLYWCLWRLCLREYIYHVYQLEFYSAFRLIHYNLN